MDRLSRLNGPNWERLKAEIAAKRVRVVALDLPTSYQLIHAGVDDFTARMPDAITGMMLDMLAATARKDDEDRCKRQAQGIVKAKAEGVYRGRPEDVKRNEAISAMLRAGQSWSSIMAATGCSRSVLSRPAKRIETV